MTNKLSGIEPLHDFVILKKNPVTENKLASGIFIPDSANRSSTFATVLAAGPGKLSPTGRLIPIRVEPGQVVLIDTICGMTMTLHGEDVVVCREAEIIAIVHQKSAD